MKIYNLRTNHLHNPLGYQLDSLRLSWVTDNEQGKSQYQAFARVEISLHDTFDELIFDSGKQADIDARCFCPNIELLPRTTYYWRVTVWGNEQEMVISEPALFETAKMDEPWQGVWITSTLDKDMHSLMRKTFTLTKRVVKARAYVCGVGLYEIEVNGNRVSDEYLAPGYHAYDYWLQYQTYDLTEHVQEGINAIGVKLGNGWYKGRFGFDGGYTNLYGEELALLADIIITYEDGSELKVSSDLSWKCNPSPIVMSNIYDGEVFDANLLQAGWTTSNFEDQTWNEVKVTTVKTEKLQARLNVPVKIMEQLKPVEIIRTPKGEVVLDFGKIITGWVRFKTSAAKGATLKLQYGEILQNDCFYRDNLRTAKAEYIYYSDGISREVEPTFTFYGFRYVNLEGFNDDINLNDFTGCVLYSELETIGSITTSNPYVNQLFNNALNGQKGNFLDVPTDCPQRDERMGWTGDAQVFAATANFNMYSAPFFHKYLVDLHQEQLRLDGSVPFTVPTVKPKDANGFINGHGSAAWGDAATIIPWNLYQMYGDQQLLREHYPIMTSWVDYIKRKDDESGSTRLWQTGFHFGDWLALDGLDPNSPLGGTDSYYIASAYYYYSTCIVAEAARVLGLSDDAEKYVRLAAEIKEAILKEYFTATGRIVIYTQTALIVALYMDLVPEWMKERVAADLRKKLKEDKLHLKTGFVGTPYMCHVLSDHQMNDEAYTLLLNDDFPSWLYSVKLGATTIWERWNSVLEDGSISGTGMNSLNHYAYGSIVEWMYKHMCGIQSDATEVGFKKIKLSPKPSARIKESHGIYHSPFGIIESKWTIQEDGTLQFIFKVPFNTTAEVYLPDATIDRIRILQGKPEYIDSLQENKVKYMLSPGSYTFEYEPTKSYIEAINSEWIMRDLLQYPEVVSIFEEIAPGLLEIELVKTQFMDMSCHEMLQIPLFHSFKIDIDTLNAKLAKVQI